MQGGSCCAVTNKDTIPSPFSDGNYIVEMLNLATGPLLFVGNIIQKHLYGLGMSWGCKPTYKTR